MSEKCPECDCEIDYVYCGNCGEMVNLDVWVKELLQRHQVNEVDELLLETIIQACSMRECPHVEYHLDSMALSAYADAIRYLAKKKLVAVESDGGRRVIAKVIGV